ncbi:transmembrane protein 11, mitochondrial isoform X1 [Ahaetulla prasina]|uniref:transmembrane protein 11, mitochondrial isoform X1 n=1 Tax=Ahaetulla prasina TaxID=499056 RepID=UPI0026491632|nr:transmembrane protein 11, mitochondrial isoform X1 [Ahaetulla prasina]
MSGDCSLSERRRSLPGLPPRPPPGLRFPAALGRRIPNPPSPPSAEPRRPLPLSAETFAKPFSKMAAWGRRRAGPGSSSGGAAARERVSLSATDCYIVHEIYNGENAQDQFEYELEQALEAQYKYIVIEPTRIGDETARWITVGNCLHKTAVLAGTACLFTPLALPVDYSHYISLPAGVLSVACCTLYGISWQFDPCCKYQVEYNAYKLSRLPLHTLTTSTPVVLVRKDDLHRKRLHNTIALAALVYCVKKVYELYAV